ncbi:MAG: dTDP-4-dehydro-6-deoxyglucose aminotransferase [Granulosicoccus sp.]|nr:dTDP-4-dehydro-6-deoxyglucose aminotransferase [Granulosicoccus sp.]
MTATPVSLCANNAYVIESNSNSEVALLGGTPAFTEDLCVGRPNVPDRSAFMARMNAMFDSGRLTNLGPMVQEFEKQVARIAGTRHCVATCNATVGLELAISALGMKGDVIVPSFTFIATVHALWRQGITPIFCDIDPVTHCLDIASVEAAMTSRTTGILGVHLWGNMSATNELHDLAQRKGVKLLFDAAHAFACGTKQRAVGSFGDAEVFSFHATKFVHAFEGGAIVTDDGDLADRLRLMTNFGFADEDEVLHLGTNGKMSEPSAAMGLTSLEAMDSIIAHNKRNYAAYDVALKAVPGVRLQYRSMEDPHNYHYVVTEIDESVTGLSRDELVAALRLENVIARRYFYPGCHRMEPYSSLFPQARHTLPVTEEISRRVIILPTGQTVNEADIGRLVGRIAAIVRRAREVRQALAECEDRRIPSFTRRVEHPVNADAEA